MESTGDLDKSSLLGVSGAEACLEEAEGGMEANSGLALGFRLFGGFDLDLPDKHLP